MLWRRKPDISATGVVCPATTQYEWPDAQLKFMVPQERLEAATLHAQHLDDVFRYVSRRVPQREEAEDITAETFAAAFEALPKFRGQCEPRLWLLGIARRKIADAMRRRKRRPETLASQFSQHSVHADVISSELAPARDEPGIAAGQAEANRQVRMLMAQLKEEQREALLLKYVEGLSINEIAVVMGRSPAAANSLLQRARATVFRQGREYFLNDEVSL